jgi:hypothetical protein
MGTVIDKNTLRVILLEILSKDKTLLKDILQDLLKHDPQLLEDFTSSGSFGVGCLAGVSYKGQTISEELTVESSRIADYETKDKSIENRAPEGVSDEELDFWVNKHFTEYEAVFKALA